MHRSGTSAVASIVAALGLKQSDHLFPANLSNPTGHFESIELLEANEEILKELDYCWDVPPQWQLSEKEINAIRDNGLLEKLRQRFQDRSIQRDWCDKDPRLTITMPIWDQVLHRRTPIIACIRTPAQVAMSLRLREGMPYELGVILWRYYNQNLRNTCRDRRSLLIDYEKDLKENTSETVKKIYEFAVNCGYSVESNNLTGACKFYQPSLQRNRSKPETYSEYDNTFSRRLERALAIYTLIRDKPISEWPDSLEDSIQIKAEDEQWLALYRKTKIPKSHQIVYCSRIAEHMPAEETRTMQTDPREIEPRRTKRMLIKRLAKKGIGTTRNSILSLAAVCTKAKRKITAVLKQYSSN